MPRYEVEIEGALHLRCAERKWAVRLTGKQKVIVTASGPAEAIQGAGDALVAAWRSAGVFMDSQDRLRHK